MVILGMVDPCGKRVIFFSHQVMAVLMGNIVDLFGKKVAIHGDSVGKLRF